MEALELVNQDWPNSNNSWPEFGTDPNLDKLNKEISITISTKRNATYRVTCRRQARCFELMESLVELCLGDDMMDALCLEGFRVASFNLLIAFWLAYFQQLNIDNNRRLRIDGNQQLTAEDDLDYDPEDFPWAVQKWKTVPFQTIPYDSQSSAEIIIYRTIVVTYIAIGLRAFDSFSWKPWNSNNDGLIQLIFRLLFSWSDALSKIAEKLKSNATPDKPAIYHEWLPRNEILVDWILLASTVYPNTVANNAKYFEAGNKTPWRLSWCIANLIAMTETLANGQVDILGSLRSTHLNTQFSDSTRKHMGLNVHQLIDFIYTASQAIDREATTPVIGAVLGQVTSYIKEAASGCPICLNSFTHGSGFYILSKVGLTESDRAAAGEAVSAVVAQLHASQIHVHENIVPSLFEAMCCVCDIDDLALCDMRPFIDGAVFQLQKLPGGIARYVTPGTISSIQKVLGKLKDWGKEWSHNGVQCLDEISALQHEVQEYTDQKTWRHWGSSRYISGAPEPPSLVVPPPDATRTSYRHDKLRTRQ
ncbi:hypothetical protein OPQ81_001195 [Rhizoctonia solani]|nr:hypothetical protein OPQ81_001195 [Rhizoctonia solani]